jgi:hypothetical protein
VHFNIIIEHENMKYFTFHAVYCVIYNVIAIFRVIKSSMVRWAGHVARMGDRRGVYRVLVGKSEGKRPPGRARRIWEDTLKLDL